jgi:hypothetical protein
LELLRQATRQFDEENNIRKTMSSRNNVERIIKTLRLIFSLIGFFFSIKVVIENLDIQENHKCWASIADMIPKYIVEH